jgi:outer membrane protein assembly factor BamA
LVGSREIAYSGHRTFRPRDLNAVVEQAGLEIDGWLDPPRVADVLQRFYRENGFLDAEVQVDRPGVAGRTARLPVTIDEGRRYTLDAIRLNGVHPDRIVTMARAANLELGMPYVSTVLEDARRRVQDQYGRLGFNEVSVEVEPVPDPDEGAVDVSFQVVEGPQQIVREVSTEGATRTRNGVIAGALDIRPGEPVDLAQWALARKRLYDTNVFRQVDIDAVPVEPTEEEKAAGIQPVRATVRVIEYPVWRLRYGLQLNDERTAIATDPQGSREQNLGILADIRNQNLFGRAITAGIAGRFEADRRSESVFLSNSSFFGLPLRTNGFIFDARQEFRQFDDEVTEIQDRRGFSVEQRWRPSWRTEVTYGVRSERLHVFDPRPPSPGGFPPVDEVYRVSKLIAAAYLDRRDDPFQPSRGWFSAVNFDQGLEFLRSDFGTSKLLVQQHYFRSFDRLVLATRAQAGVEFSDENLPRSERFLLGGATTVRGYAQDSLGPFDDILGPVGGESLLLFNAEARFPLRGWLQGVVFVDAGNVFEGKLVSLGDLKVGYGFGLRLASPFALLRADFGIPASADRPGEPRSKARFYFGIGHIF